ncbi:substrate-binding domain-containing protein [Devosia sp. YIM 151766]|uniref:substrate-binding domain-containing protein n=1 Tax=Devosia sp. YIM 151766 TaxID=3017325 RepID=UPI00255C3EC5|nr:substrate-binding domain-containing protein [Devosia sp. YIM 151766]WIY52593.1 substrate-binding domain-containing protein [Devosia sp. YIM 151766]
MNIKTTRNLLGAAVFATAMLGAGALRAQEEIKIGVVNLSLCCAYFVGMDAAVKDEASAYSNVRLLSTDADGDVAKLTSDVEDLLNQGVSGLIVSGAFIEAAPAALEAITEAGVPVVMVDRLLKGGDYTSWVGPDNRAIGEGIGDYIVDRLGGSGKVVIIRGGPADNTIGSNRTDGVSAKLAAANLTAVVAPGWGDWSADGGFRQMEDMLSKETDISAVFCENDSMCLGAQNAIADAGLADSIFIASVDGEAGALAEIAREGSNYGATGLNSADQIGRAGFNRLMAILAGAAAPKDTAMPSPIITKDNVARFINEDSVF